AAIFGWTSAIRTFRARAWERWRPRRPSLNIEHRRRDASGPRGGAPANPPRAAAQNLLPGADDKLAPLLIISLETGDSRIHVFARMTPSNRLHFSLLAALSLCGGAACGADSKPYSGIGCAAADDFFVEEVWAKVAAHSCIKCHKSGGDAEDSKFVLRDPKRVAGAELAEAMRGNREAFAKMARTKEGDESRLLLKAVGKLDHEGEDVLKPDSAGYRVLADFVRQVNGTSAATLAHAMVEDKNAPPFFDGVVMLDDRRLLRRVTLSLAGRLPTESELGAVGNGGLQAFPALLDALMKEEGFYDRLREGFEDIFLTTGYDDVPETALGYENFPDRLWTTYQKPEELPEFFAGLTDEKEIEKARYQLTGVYRQALLGEPMKFIEHIVRNDRPFTEIVTADYIVVTPYTARGYGIWEEVRGKFKNPDDPFEYIPVKLDALVARSKESLSNQESPTGFYPHAGLLTSFQYLRRYPTTETNRNRLRARMVFQHFLGIDVLELAARVSDAAAVSARYEIPTMQASECVVCHKTIDPVAGLFQDYWATSGEIFGAYGRRKEGWFKDMFQAGLDGEDLAESERWRSLQWLGERIAKDPRFAVAMVEHAYSILTGRKVLLPPKDLEDPLYNARRRAWQTQRKQIETMAARFATSGFNFKDVLKEWVLTDFYRADGLATAEANPKRRAELDDIGLARLLSPEQVERKVAAIFGQPWGKLTNPDDKLDILYGGIDSKEITERAADPSGVMGAIQRILANEVACQQTALDFSRPPAQRRLFPDIEPDVLPGSSPEADAKIRRTIVHLHQLVLGRDDQADSSEVDRTFALFAGIIADARERGEFEKLEIYHCHTEGEKRMEDPQYTVRAWRAVVTYLLRQHEFLYE
ncbi:MAG: hypothetical protein ABI680_00460, partial [Chthoniobacteraceae bacterium]